MADSSKKQNDDNSKASELLFGSRNVLVTGTIDDKLAKSVATQLLALAEVSDDPIIATCWDADRPDIGRVGRKPHPSFLSTDEAKKPSVIEWAWKRSRKARK